MSEKRTIRDIWEASRANLALVLDPSAYALNVERLRAVSWENGTLTLLAPSQMAREWCEIRLNRAIEREVCLEAGRSVRVVYVVGEVCHAD